MNRLNIEYVSRNWGILMINVVQRSLDFDRCEVAVSSHNFSTPIICWSFALAEGRSFTDSKNMVCCNAATVADIENNKAMKRAAVATQVDAAANDDTTSCATVAETTEP